MPRKSKPAINPKDPTLKQLGSGVGVTVSKEQMVSKIYTYRQELLRSRNDWLKKMNDDTHPIELKLKRLETRFIAQYGTEEFYKYE